MNSKGFQVLLGGVSIAALTAGIAYATEYYPAEAIYEIRAEGSYLAGDYHNHTTCTDGAMSVETVVSESLITYGLDWFAQTGHGGEGPRDCRFDDPEYNGANSGAGDYWENTVGLEGIEGDEENTSGYGASAFFEDGDAREMWRWQIIDDFAYDLQAQVGRMADKPAWIGVEHNAPGHEHISMGILNGQFRGAASANATATAQFEYLWDRSDDDGSAPRGFEDGFPAEYGLKSELKANGTLSEAETGLAGHERAVNSVTWLRDNFRANAYYVPAHVERQGGFDPNSTRGFNVEHLRDFHNAGLLTNRFTGPSIAFGAEMLAGHQFANGGRGTYELDRPTAGLGTYGGAGAYSGAEVAVPGHAFDGGEGLVSGNTSATTDIVMPTHGGELTEDDLIAVRDAFDANFDGRLTEPSGSDHFDSLQLSDTTDADNPYVRFVLGRPGVATMWDAMLGEGRRYFNFTNSDWHNRGRFGPFEPQSTLDAWPGEYGKVYSYVEGEEFGFKGSTARKIVEGMRTGNSYSVHGDLVSEFYMAMCQGDRCATMGETLKVRADGEPTVQLRMYMIDPDGENMSPYKFDNPSLLQIGMNQPMNEPVLDHVDVIRGDITGEITSDQAEYKTTVANHSAEIAFRFDDQGSHQLRDNGDGYLVADVDIPTSSITNDMYFRARGTNMPVGTPNETDLNGNPLLDDFSALIPCTATGSGVSNEEIAADAAAVMVSTGNSGFRTGNSVTGDFDPYACPAHLPIDENGVKFLDADVEAWADLWFYANPIFIEYEPAKKMKKKKKEHRKKKERREKDDD